MVQKGQTAVLVYLGLRDHQERQVPKDLWEVQDRRGRRVNKEILESKEGLALLAPEDPRDLMEETATDLKDQMERRERQVFQVIQDYKERMV